MSPPLEGAARGVTENGTSTEDHHLHASVVGMITGQAVIGLDQEHHLPAIGADLRRQTVLLQAVPPTTSLRCS